MDQFFRVQKIEKRFQRKAQHDYDHLNLNPEITFAMSSEVYTLQEKKKWLELIPLLKFLSNRCLPPLIEIQKASSFHM